MTEDLPQRPVWTGWRRGLALLAGLAALVHGGFTVFDEQHNGGAGTSIVLAMVQIAALLMGRAATPAITVLLGLVVAGRVVIRFALGASFDWLGAAVAVLVVVAGLSLRGRARTPAPS